MNKRVQPDLLTEVAQVEQGTVGTVVSNGKELILVPEPELRKVDAMADKPSSDTASDERDDFDWLTDESVLIPEQQAIAVYRNRKGALVIRQERSWCDEQDSFVIIHADNAQAFLDKLCDVLGVHSAP